MLVMVAAILAPAGKASADGHPIGLSPASAHRGDTVTISGGDCGTGFGAHIAHIVVADELTGFVVNADINGEWTATYTVPNGATIADHAIQATCRDYDNFPVFDYDQTTLTVLPSPPVPSALQSTGVAPAVQSVTVTIPAGGSVALLTTGGQTAYSVSVAGQGTYQLDPSTGQLTFTPQAGYFGIATPVAVRVSDHLGQHAETTYTPTVLAPAGPSAPALATAGPNGAQQLATVTLPPGTTITLLDETGSPTNAVVIGGIGTYSLDPALGTITFTPLAGYTGTAPAVTYQLTDQYTNHTTATYAATVLASDTTPTTVPAPTPSAALPVTGAGSQWSALIVALCCVTLGYALMRLGRPRVRGRSALR